MVTVVVTDCKYRSSVAVVRSLGRAGYNVVAAATERDVKGEPPAFFSKYVNEKIMLEGSVNDAEYKGRLEALLSKYENPVLFPVGAKTFETVSKNIEEFSACCRFNMSRDDVLERANDKIFVTRLAHEIGIPTPCEYSVDSPSFPCIIKPRCGEKAGLKAANRYIKCYNKEQFDRALEKITQYDKTPIVEELVEGDGEGVSVVMDKNKKPASIICHRRIREYPISGGPSACLESIYDDKLVDYAVKLLSALDFHGIAMVEFKGGRLLEINPRVWGSFPMTEYADSNFSENYVRTSLGESFDEADISYKRGVKMHFAVNDAACVLSLIRHGKIKKAMSGIADFIRPGVRDGLRDKEDKKPFRVYIRQVFGR